MKLLLKIPLSIPDSFAGDFLEAQQNVVDLFFRDLHTSKQLALIETFGRNYPGTPEHLEAVRLSLKNEIEIIEAAMESKTIELVHE
jgi:hypothetical protein